ncbi:hypothetical protein EAI_10125, partial [Harpegnathos saltator]
LYTDGSKLGSGETGCAVFSFDPLIEKRFSLSSLIFIFGAEITALLHALRISDE